MQRVDKQEILDSGSCPPGEAQRSLRDLSLINRWFGGVATTRNLIARVATDAGRKHFSLLEVASGFGEVPKTAARQLAANNITLDLTLLDRFPSHLLPGNRSVVADALALPFPDNSFDLVGSSLFAHHLQPGQLTLFAKEALRVSRSAVLINDLVRHPLHVALVYAGFPLMRSYVSRADGVTSVKRSYLPEELRAILAAAWPNGSAPKIDISRHYLFRLGAIVWKRTQCR